MFMSIVEVKNITKIFHTTVRPEGEFGILKSLFKHDKKEIKAVQNINISIQHGESVAYLGPNGAGCFFYCFTILADWIKELLKRRLGIKKLLPINF